MNKIIILSIVFVGLFISVSFAQTSIKAEVDKTSLSVSEPLTYKLTITSSDKDIPAPQLPKFTGFQVISSAQSSSLTFANGEAKAVVIYAFVLSPIEIGKFKIGPSSVKIKNETFSTVDFEIDVKQGKPKSKVEPKKRPHIPEETQPEETQVVPQITL